jgi:hypothetical protein
MSKLQNNIQTNRWYRWRTRSSIYEGRVTQKGTDGFYAVVQSIVNAGNGSIVTETFCAPKSCLPRFGFKYASVFALQKMRRPGRGKRPFGADPWARAMQMAIEEEEERENG